MSATDAITLTPSPADSISHTSFSPTRTTLLTTTWSGTSTLHNAYTGHLQHDLPSHPHAILDATWTTSPCLGVAAASLDGSVLHAPLAEGGVKEWRMLGKHSEGVRAVCFNGGRVVSGGWDGFVKLWDAREARGGEEVDAGGKVYGAARCGENCVVLITSSRKVRVLDVRKADAFVHDRVPPTLEYQLRGVSANKSGTQIAVGSTEGRVAVEWLEGDGEPFSFKCHRLDGMAFPVNCISHSNKYGSFATGGGDGHVSFWDGEARKRIAQYARYPSSVACVDFDAESERIAIAVSYTYEEGEKDHPSDEVHVRMVDDAHIAIKRAPEDGGVEEAAVKEGEEGSKEKALDS